MQDRPAGASLGPCTSRSCAGGTQPSPSPSRAHAAPTESALAAGIHACAQPSPSASRATRARRPACAIYIYIYYTLQVYVHRLVRSLPVDPGTVSQITVQHRDRRACSTTCMLLYVLCRERPAASRVRWTDADRVRWMVRPVR
jgi:hypothetical protein